MDTTDGTPSIGLSPGGGNDRSAGYLRGSGTTELVFGYTLTDGDGDHDTLLVPPNSLALNGGAIRSTETQADAALEHNGAAAAGSQGRKSKNPQDGEKEKSPRAWFEDVPDSHDGRTPFHIELHFNEEPEDLSYTTVQEAVDATGTEVAEVRRKTPGQNQSWIFEVAPNQGDEVTLRLPTLDCDEPDAICVNEKRLDQAAETTVTGLPFTATFSGTTEEHDGSSPFDLKLEFSHEPQDLNYGTVRDHLLNLTGATVQRVWRTEAGQSRNWRITVVPAGLEDIAVSVLETVSCAADHAVCDAAGRMLPGDLEATVTGPPTLSVDDAEVQEAQGATLTFTVTLSRSVATEVSVEYATQDGIATAGEDYAATAGTLTFAPGTTTRNITVPVNDDQDDGEGAETLTLTLSNSSPSRVKLADAQAIGIIR